MRSTWRRGTQPTKFRIAWRGYDRAEVDECLQRADAEQQRLHEEVARLSALKPHGGPDGREFERLAAVRREVASYLETSIGALRNANALLGGPGTTAPAAGPVRQIERTPPPIPAEHLTASLRFRDARFADPEWPAASVPAPVSGPRRFSLSRLSVIKGKQTALGAGLLAVLVFAGIMYRREPVSTEIPTAAAPAPPPDVAQALPPEPASTPPDAAREDGLVLTLTGLRASWVNTTLDGGQRMERLLAPNETILLRATNEAILRVGDATAVSVLINNQPARPLGSTGQVVTARITTDNYRKLLRN